MIAFVFPGQGSQQVGMGRALYDAYPYLRPLYDEADAALSHPLRLLCFEGPEDELTRTKWTQPALLLTSIAAATVLDRELGLRPTLAAGHSLGEYSALVVAGALRFSDAVRLVHLRGQFMQEAVPEGKGAMAAVVGLDAESVAQICAQAQSGDESCQPANENGAGQIVVSGHRPAVERVVALAKAAGSKLVKLLPVSAPFHSALMQPAADRLAAELAVVPIAAPRCTVLANIDAEPYPSSDDSGEAVRSRLVRQVAGTVRWERCVQKLAALGATAVVEVGHGRVLSGMVKRITPGLPLYAVGQPADLEALRSLPTQATR
ncbi:MAG: ACP S-malonyltransferase [Myxococcales bacterium]|nr:ACP S-malonyltransferase [Myxococcales bacterium]